jgi:drug/metabolite transporter (DMT)-like permease
MPNFRSSTGSVLALIAIAIIWGYNWTQMKIAVQYAPPFAFSAIRTLLSGLCLLLIIAVQGRSLKPADVPQTVLIGVLQIGGMYGFSNWALVSGGVGKTAILAYMMPFWVLILAWVLLGERVKWWQWVAIALSFVGLVLTLDPLRLQGTLISQVLAVLAGISWAGGVVATKQLQQAKGIENVVLFAAWQALFASAALGLVALLVPGRAIDWSAPFVFALAYNVIPGTAIAQVLWVFVLRQLPAGTAGLGMLMTPIMGIVFASIQLGERPSAIELAGMGLMLGGLALNALQPLLQAKLRG